jgi:hypothetical protein
MHLDGWQGAKGLIFKSLVINPFLCYDKNMAAPFAVVFT